MNLTPSRPAALLLLALLLVGEAKAQTTIVDIIPKKSGRERRQNSEPNIAVDPADPNKIVISSFGAPRNPIFISKDGGASWAILQSVAAGDISVGWASPDAYLTVLTRSGSSIGTLRLHNPDRRSTFRGVRRSTYRPGGDGPDQPWTEATNLGGIDHIYVALNDLSQNGRTASIRQSLDGGVTWANVVIERADPGSGADGAAVRVAARGARVYGVFQRYNSNVNPQDSQSDVVGDIVVVRDDAAGAEGYARLGTGGAGVKIASGAVLPQGFLGQERLGSDLSIAVDPNNVDHVAVAYAVVRSNRTVVALAFSTNGGASWSEVYTSPADSALPALAIAGNGAIGLLYTSYDGTFLETHLVQSTSQFATKSDLTLSRFADSSLASDFDPYIGDYEDLAAVGNTFYGTFAASNDTKNFPQQPTFLRDQTLLTSGRIPFSIDPFFFKTPALP